MDENAVARCGDRGSRSRVGGWSRVEERDEEFARRLADYASSAAAQDRLRTDLHLKIDAAGDLDRLVTEPVKVHTPAMVKALCEGSADDQNLKELLRGAPGKPADPAEVAGKLFATAKDELRTTVARNVLDQYGPAIVYNRALINAVAKTV